MNPVPEPDPAAAGPRGAEFARQCADLRAEIHAAAAVLDQAMPQLLDGFRAVAAAAAGDAAVRREAERLVVALQFHDVLAQGFVRIQAGLQRLEGLGGRAVQGHAAPRALQPGEIELF